MNKIAVLLLAGIMPVSQAYMCSAGAALSLTQFDKYHATTNYLDNIKFPITSFSAHNEGAYVACSTVYATSYAERSIDLLIDVSLYLDYKTHLLSVYHDAAAIPLSSFRHEFVEKPHVSGSVSVLSNNLFLGVVAHALSYDIQLSFFEQPMQQVSWDYKLAWGIQAGMHHPITRQVTLGFVAQTLFGPDTLATDVPDITMTNPADTTNLTTSWLIELNKTTLHRLQLQAFIGFTPKFEEG